MIKVSFSREKPTHNEAGRPWYDTKKGVEESLKSLESLHLLTHERHLAGYTREEKLNQFLVFGRYMLDSCGNCSRSTDAIPKEIWPNIPDVLTWDEFHDYKEECSKDLVKDIGFSFSIGDDGIPLPGLKCAECGEPWEIQNCHDTVVYHDTEVVNLGYFVGMPLENVKVAFAKRDSAIFRMQSDILIRNDDYIDLSPEYPNPESDWEKTVVKNKRGWRSGKEGIGDDYVIRTGDEAFFNVWSYFHSKCNRKHLSETAERKFKKIFEGAGFKDIRMMKIPNEYCSCNRCLPWFYVNTEFGTFKIGWRKRVIDIAWCGLLKTLTACGQKPKKNILSLFEKEDVTKGETNIHAWGWEKAEEYLSKIYNLLLETKS